jgi:hypothetical protein
VNHNGTVINTEKKIWIHNFSVDKDTGIGKTDFGFKVRMAERPSVELREWMKRDLIVELWETRPRIVEKKQEDETMAKETVFDENGKPVIDKKLRGVSIINISK